MKITKRDAFTVPELLVVVSLIALIALLALLLHPAYDERKTEFCSLRALMNAKQIGTACKLFAMDFGGHYPPWTDEDIEDVDPQLPTTMTDLTDSSAILKALIPDYLEDETIFWNPKAAGYCRKTPPDNRISTDDERLAPGENAWGYMAGLTNTSNSRWPLIADATVSATVTNYDKDETRPGGVWKGKKAVIIRADASGVFEPLNSKNLTIKRDDDPAKDALVYDASLPWLSREARWYVPPAIPSVEPGFGRGRE